MFGWALPYGVHIAIFKEKENKIHLTQTITKLLFHESKDIIWYRTLENPSLLSLLTVWDLEKLTVTM